MSAPTSSDLMLASLDFLSKGRAGWNVVTSKSPSEAANFGLKDQRESPDRYVRANEFRSDAGQPRLPQQGTRGVERGDLQVAVRSRQLRPQGPAREPGPLCPRQRVPI